MNFRCNSTGCKCVTILQLSVNKSQSLQVSRSKCSHLCQHVHAHTAFSVLAVRATLESLCLSELLMDVM